MTATPTPTPIAGQLVLATWGIAVTDFMAAINAQWTDLPAASIPLTQGVSVAKVTPYAAWARVGRNIRFQGVLQPSGTGTAGATISIGLPVAIRAGTIAASRPIGTALLYDYSAGLFYRALALPLTATTFAMMGTHATGGNYLGAMDFVAAIGANDSISWDICYEAATA